MVEGRAPMPEDEFRGDRLRIYGTNINNPEEGRIFVWTRTGWFERIRGSPGNVAFALVADSDTDLQKLLIGEGPSVDLVEMGDRWRKTVSEEFLEQEVSFRDSSGYLVDEPIDEDEDQQYHQHD
jgi:hypothetical protein